MSDNIRHPLPNNCAVAQLADNPVVKWKLSDLKEHPRQREFFPKASCEADLELAADMNENGQQDPIEILPNGEIICGHRRVNAARSLGWTEIDSIVRHDLADDPEAAEARLIDDNYNRRHLTTFQKIRCAARRVELAQKGKVSLPEECDQFTKTRDKIGYLANISGRNADRYLKVFSMPREVQDAVDGGYLTLIEAGTLSFLDEVDQQAIAAELGEQGIEHAKAIYEEYAPSKAETTEGANSIWRKFRRAAHGAKQLRGNMTNIRFLDDRELTFLKELLELVDGLHDEVMIYLTALDDDDEEFSDIGELDQLD